MGEFADALIDAHIHEMWGFSPRRHRHPATRVTCQYCGKRNLRWQNIAGGAWRLFTPQGERHICGTSRMERFMDQRDDAHA